MRTAEAQRRRGRVGSYAVPPIVPTDMIMAMNHLMLISSQLTKWRSCEVLFYNQ